jgi:hypothetical protein
MVADLDRLCAKSQDSQKIVLNRDSIWDSLTLIDGA